jgi:hypothetical protein
MSQTKIQEPQCQAEGEIVYSVFGDRGRLTREKHMIYKKRFVVARKGQEWKIRTSALNEAIEYEETGCDGLRFFELRQMNEEKIRQERGELSPNCRTTSGWVRYGKFPAGMDSSMVFPLWLAFCSTDYFHHHREGRIVSPEFPQDAMFCQKAVPAFHARSAKWQLNRSFLPSKIEWRLEGKEYGFPPPFDGEFLSASFEVLQWGEFLGLQLPTNFELKTFFPNNFQLHPDPTQGELCQSWLIEAKVHCFHDLSDFSCLPVLTKTAIITDGRYHGGCCPDGWLSYGSSTWMTEEEVEAKNKQHGVKCEKQIPQD